MALAGPYIYVTGNVSTAQTEGSFVVFNLFVARVHGGLFPRTIALMPEANRFTSVGLPNVSRTPAGDILTGSFLRQISLFAPDGSPFSRHSWSFVRHSGLTMKGITGMTMVIVRQLSLIIAHVFHITAEKPIITARITGITGVMSIIVRTTRVTVGTIWLIIAPIPHSSGPM